MLLRGADLTEAARAAVLERYAEDACFLGYGACASESLVRAREALERPVQCGGDAVFDVVGEPAEPGAETLKKL